MVSTPGSPHDNAALLSSDVLYQVHMHDAGRIALPGRRFHELFEEQVLAHPDAVAVRYNSNGWTYAELNRRANQIAHELLHSGLRPEDVVGVMTDRTLDWAAAVIGVFKAGGVYLPIDSAYPAERARVQIRRSSARFLLAAQNAAGRGRFDSDATVLPLVPDAGVCDTNPRVKVRERQLAYIYFTSGSTGLPKGAMCEHLGMLNHLLAKTDALGLGPGDVVVQNAPVGFDISLWQLIAVLLVGGRVEIISTEEILDADRFLDVLVGADASVLQVVPSYLDVLLGELEVRARPLGRLRCVSVTGEAISAQLVARWFARCPAIMLVNAYGATEASDDTTHAIIDAPLDAATVPVGRPIRNVAVYIVDERLRVVALGAVGEIVFSGICVGRGYVNDPERTREVFMTDPYRPDARLYRTGDFGRWLPDGNLEFLGRRDEQVKIRGMRVETGEVEHLVLGVPGVRSAAVVVRENARGKILIACYTAGSELTQDRLMDRLRSFLPAHLVPAACHRLDSLPVTENGKTDRRALLAMLESDDSAVTGPVPASATEQLLAVAWAEVLGMALSGIVADDDFFALGGDSLAAVRLVVKLNRALSLTDLLHYPVLRDLAALIDGRRLPPGNSILQQLSRPDDCDTVMICVPDAGGNAMEFQQLARVAGKSGVTVWAAELPGHDVGRESEPPTGVQEVAARIMAEIGDLASRRLMMWGHGSGASIAIRVVQLLTEANFPVSRLFVASRPLDEPGDACGRLVSVESLSDEEVKAILAGYAGFTELDDLKPERGQLVAAAYRHDVCTDLRYLASQLTMGARILAPVTVVSAADDLASTEHAAGTARWRRLADDLTVEVLPYGGRHFHRTEPELTLAAILRG
jgi:amino acid adenylation domain-containing protein